MLLKYFAPKYLLTMGLLTMVLGGCKKLVDAGGSRTSSSSVDVYNSDASAISVLTGLYASMSQSGISSGGLTSMSFFPALSADELTLYSGALSNLSFDIYYTNSLTSANTGGTDFWNAIYPIVYEMNSAIEGFTSSTGITAPVKKQLMGEAKFMRAFCYFYLVALYGDVPLPTTSSYTANAVLARASKETVYNQIIVDLKEAQSLLSADYLDASLVNGTAERVRPTRGAATALLSRTYLYTGQWDSAVVYANSVIGNTGLYSLSPLNEVFLKNSAEAIWQLQPVIPGQNTADAWLFTIPPSGPDGYSYPVYLSDTLLNSFEPGDQRRTNWVDSVNASGITYYYAYKYKSATLNAGVTEYEVVFRLSEQYLIRAEALAELGDFANAARDLDTIRNRAGLANTTASDLPSFLNAILHERQVELFTEWGHRWLDLKRSNTINKLMSVITPGKGGAAWATTQQYYPIPIYEIQHDPNLVQNQGY